MCYDVNMLILCCVILIIIFSVFFLFQIDYFNTTPTSSTTNPNKTTTTTPTPKTYLRLRYNSATTKWMNPLASLTSSTHLTKTSPPSPAMHPSSSPASACQLESSPRSNTSSPRPHASSPCIDQTPLPERFRTDWLHSKVERVMRVAFKTKVRVKHVKEYVFTF